MPVHRLLAEPAPAASKSHDMDPFAKRASIRRATWKGFVARSHAEAAESERKAEDVNIFVGSDETLCGSIRRPSGDRKISRMSLTSKRTPTIKSP